MAHPSILETLRYSQRVFNDTRSTIIVLIFIVLGTNREKFSVYTRVFDESCYISNTAILAAFFILLFILGHKLIKRYSCMVVNNMSCLVLILLSSFAFTSYQSFFFAFPISFLSLIVVSSIYHNDEFVLKTSDVIINNLFNRPFIIRGVGGPLGIIFYIVNTMIATQVKNSSTIGNSLEYRNYVLLLCLINIFTTQILHCYYGPKNLYYDVLFKVDPVYYFNFCHRNLLYGIGSIFVNSYMTAFPIVSIGIVENLIDRYLSNENFLIISFNILGVVYIFTRVINPYIIVFNLCHKDAWFSGHILRYKKVIMGQVLAECKIALYFTALASSSINIFRGVYYLINGVDIANSKDFNISLFISLLPYNYLMVVRVSNILFDSISSFPVGNK